MISVPAEMESVESIVWAAQQVLASDLGLVILTETKIEFALAPALGLVLEPDFSIAPEKVRKMTRTS